MDEAYFEHDGAQKLIAEIEAIKPSEKYHDAQVKVLGGSIKRHVEDEKPSCGVFA